MIPLIRDVGIGKFTDRKGDLSLPGRGSGGRLGNLGGGAKEGIASLVVLKMV